METFIWKYLRSHLIILFIFGICPFSLYNKHYITTWPSFLYSIILLLTIVSTSIYITLPSSFLANPKDSNTYYILTRIYILALYVFFISSQILSIWYRKLHANLLNHLVFIKMNLKLIKQVTFNYMAIYIYLCCYLLLILLNLIFRFLPVEIMLFNIIFTVKLTSQMLLVAHVRCISYILSIEISRVSYLIQEIINSIQLESHYKSLLILFQQFENILKIKQIFSATFSIQLFVILGCDFMILTMFSYQIATFVITGTIFSEYITIITFYILPQLIKCVVLIATLDHLGDKVNQKL